MTRLGRQGSWEARIEFFCFLHLSESDDRRRRNNQKRKGDKARQEVNQKSVIDHDPIHDILRKKLSNREIWPQAF